MKRIVFRNRQFGFSLVEMMVSLGILGIIGVGVARFAKNYESSKARSNAQSYTKKINKRLLKFAKRDMKFQTAFNLEDDGLSLEITRRKTFDSADTDATYTVKYLTRCVSIPNAVLDIMQDKVYKIDKVRNKIFSADNPCFEKLSNKCDPNEYPQVFIEYDDSDDRIPAYRPNLYPDFTNSTAQKSIRKGTVGVAMCSGMAGDKIQIMVNSVFLSGRVEGEENIRIVSDQVLLSTGNIAGVTLLPNE